MSSITFTFRISNNKEKQMKKINIGDRVRFLNAKGGGIIRRIEGKIVWVEGEDGFELPTPLGECVVVSDKDTFIPAYRTPLEIKQEEESRNLKKESFSEKECRIPEKSQEEPTPPLGPERADGDQMSVYLAWLPEDFAHFNSGKMECYLINDTNYILFYTFGIVEGNHKHKLLSSGEIDRDTKLLVDSFELADLNEREELFLSIISYKKGKSYIPKSPISLTYRMDSVKFFKRHCFIENDFFEEDALVVPIVEQDKIRIKNTQQLEDKLKENFDTKRKKISTARPPKKIETHKNSQRRDLSREPLEIDLHINELLPTTQGLSNADILNYQLEVFRSKINENIRNKGAKIVFIHGKGEGVLRNALLNELKKKYPKLSAQDASFEKYGFGATMITIH